MSRRSFVAVMGFLVLLPACAVERTERIRTVTRDPEVERATWEEPSGPWSAKPPSAIETGGLRRYLVVLEHGWLRYGDKWVRAADAGTLFGDFFDSYGIVQFGMVSVSGLLAIEVTASAEPGEVHRVLHQARAAGFADVYLGLETPRPRDVRRPVVWTQVELPLVDPAPFTLAVR